MSADGPEGDWLLLVNFLPKLPWKIGDGRTWFVQPKELRGMGLTGLPDDVG